MFSFCLLTLKRPTPTPRGWDQECQRWGLWAKAGQDPDYCRNQSQCKCLHFTAWIPDPWPGPRRHFPRLVCRLIFYTLALRCTLVILHLGWNLICKFLFYSIYVGHPPGEKNIFICFEVHRIYNWLKCTWLLRNYFFYSSQARYICFIYHHQTSQQVQHEE